MRMYNSTASYEQATKEDIDLMAKRMDIECEWLTWKEGMIFFDMIPGYFDPAQRARLFYSLRDSERDLRELFDDDLQFASCIAALTSKAYEDMEIDKFPEDDTPVLVLNRVLDGKFSQEREAVII